MALKKFADYAKDFNSKNEKTNNDTSVLKNLKSIDNTSKEKSLVENIISKKTKIKDLKTTTKLINKPIIKKVNENSFLVGSDFKVKLVIDVPQSLVQEYINKVKEETDKDPLENFSEAEIAEQIISFIIKQNLVLDNLTSEFTVGSESIGSSEKSQSSLDSDAEELSNDLGVENDSEDADGEIEFKDYNETDTDTTETVSDDESSDGDIEFNDSDTEEKDLGEDREVDNNTSDENASDPDSNFDEIEFDDNDKKVKTVGDLKKSQGQKVDTQHKEEVSSEEEEEEIEDMYKKIGYKVGYFENLNLNNLGKI